MKKIIFGIVSIIAITLFMNSCEKDNDLLPKVLTDNIQTRSVQNSHVTNEEIISAKQLFYAQVKIAINTSDDQKGPLMDEWTKILPAWNEGKVVILNSKRIIFFPTINGFTDSRLQVVFHSLSKSDNYIKLIGFWGEVKNNNANTFDGGVFEITPNGYMNHEVTVINGEISGFFTTGFHQPQNTNNSNLIELRGPEDPDWWWDNKDPDAGQDGCAILRCEEADCECKTEALFGWKDFSGGFHIGNYGDFASAHCNDNINFHFDESAGYSYYCDCPIDDDDDDIDDDVDDDDDIRDDDDFNNPKGGGGGKYKITDVIQTLINGMNSKYLGEESCGNLIDSDISNFGFSVGLESADEIDDLPAVVIIQIWGNKVYDALVLAMSNKYKNNLKTAEFNTPKHFDNSESGHVNLAMGKSIVKALEHLKLSINSAGNDCSAIMKMAEFNSLLLDLYDNELTIMLNKTLELNCDIKNIYDTEAKEIIQNLIDNNDLQHECQLPNKDTKSILSKVVNDVCSFNDLKKEDFYNNLGDFMMGEPIDFLTAEPREIADKLLYNLKYSNWLDKVGDGTYRSGKIHLNEIFNNLPSDSDWSSHKVGNLKCINTSKTQGGEIEEMKISFHFRVENSCVYSKPSRNFDFNDDDGSGLTHYYKFNFKDCDAEELWETIGIRVKYNDYDIFYDYIVNTKDWASPH